MSEKPIYQDESFSFVKRAQDLVSRMTLEEKISQMMHNSKAIERLGIPSYNWWNEALHGVARAGVATMFPQAIGIAATFDADLVKKAASITSTEGRAKYHEFQKKGDHDIYKGLTFWAPNINIFRDPRWGRGQETYGEDPYLTGRLGVAFIEGLQGDHPKYLKAAACAKHFAVHSGPESERHQFNATVSTKDLWETYLPAFKECVKEAKVAGVMGAYNRTNGEPCCGSETFLQKILRRNWGFDGYITSDCWAIKDFHEGHHVTDSFATSTALALKNGCDLNCGCAYVHLMVAYNEGLIAESDLDKAVIHLMTIRMRLGMFDSPENNPYASIDYTVNDCPEHRQFALEVSKKSLVLLKNEAKLLPLDKKRIKSIAVIGPNADSREALIGNYNGTASEYITVLQGIREAVDADTRIYYAEGCHLWKEQSSDLGCKGDRLAEAVSAAENADVVVLCLGLDATNIEGEEGNIPDEFLCGDKKDLNLPGLQQELLEKVSQTGKPVILVLLSGSALAIPWAEEHIPAIVQAWYPGAQGGRALASLLFGEYSPSGRLPVTFYRSTEDLPDFHDYSMENRTYRYFRSEPLYPFGYGLSYTTFDYDGLTLSNTSIAAGESIHAKVKLKNSGSMAAWETTQLYLKDTEASVKVPIWQLAGVKNSFLQPGQETEVSFEISPRQMALIDNNGDCVLEPGNFQLFIGGYQPDARSHTLTNSKILSATFAVKGNSIKIAY